MTEKKQDIISSKELTSRIEEENSHKENSVWYLTYLDTITLLLAFIVIMAGIAGVNIFLFDDGEMGLRSELDRTVVMQTPIFELEVDLNTMLSEKLQDGSLIIETDERELRMHFRGSSFYRVGEAELLPSGQAIIDRILSAIKELEFYRFNVDVEGHADSTPIQTMRFPSNWELSVARASNIVRYFIARGFEPERLKASGYGDVFPVAPNQDEFGNPIPENQDMNRRVVIRLFY